MNTDAEARTEIFNTPILSEQILKFISGKPNHSCTLAEVREVFSDISRGYYASTISALHAKGAVIIDEEIIRLGREVSRRGHASDRCWRAVRLCKIFTTSQIRELVPDLTIIQIRDIVHKFAKSEAVKAVGRDNNRQRIYQCISDSNIRPLIPNPNKKRGAKVDAMWTIANRYTEEGRYFTVNDIAKETGLTYGYCRNVILQWRGEGVIEDIVPDRRRGQLALYKVIAEDRGKLIYHYKEGNG